MPICNACSREVPQDCRSCPACGAPLGNNQPADERSPDDSTIDGGSSILASGESEERAASLSAAIDHGQFLPGSLIQNRYRVVARIGRGGMGEIYRADDLKLGQAVALKFLPPHLSKDTKRLERFRREVRIARQVAHPNVCRVYDIGEFDNLTFITMEFVDGEDLSSLLRRIGPLPGPKAIEMARQLCAGLAAAHQADVLHRDLKPTNVMIDGQGKVRITDFGLASLVEDAAQSDPRAGTPAYMAPERLAGQDATTQGDLYSLGLVLYEMFTGERVCKAKSLSELRRFHEHSAIVHPSRLVDEINPAVERVILHCLQAEPSDRPRSALEVAAALPGGDPLRAALAAGETPSPELVAAATPAEGVPQSVAAASLVVILAGLATLPFLNDQTKLHGFIELPKPPDVLAYTARQILEQCGLRERPRDRAYGFETNEAYLRRLEIERSDSARWSDLVLGAPPAMLFWYRESPEYMTPGNPVSRVAPDDPPLDDSGMASVQLDPQGRLLAMLIVPPDLESQFSADGAVNWASLLGAAGLNPPRLERVRPRTIPPVYCDTRAAWRGALTTAPEVRVHVEAGACRGQPIYLTVSYDSAPGGYAPPGDLAAALLAGHVLEGLLFLAALIGAGIMARRNLRLGRGDRRGARHLALFVGGAFLVAWLLQTRHVPEARRQLEMAAAAIGRTLFIAAMCWLFYIALEPSVRRRWPDMLISWNRLLAGRVRDPLVGRDIIIGALFGMFAMVVTAARFFGPGLFGAPPPRPASVPEMTLLGLRYEVAELILIVIRALAEPMLLVVLLLVFLVLLRQRWASLAGFFATMTTVTTLLTIPEGGNIWVNLVYYALLVAALIFVLMRFGLLAVIVALFYLRVLESYPITAQTSAWYAGTTWFALGIAGGLALYGFSIALGERPARQAIAHWRAGTPAPPA